MIAPGSIAADLAVNLPATRDQITTRESLEFVAARTEIARLLRDRAPTTEEHRWIGT